MAVKYVFNPFTGTLDAVVTAVNSLESDSGEFTVAAGVAAGDLLYSSGSLTAALADNGAVSTAPAIGFVLTKDTTTTATVSFAGTVALFLGLIVGDTYFMGTSGGIVNSSSLPTATGSVIQKIGVAVSATTILLNIQAPVVL